MNNDASAPLNNNDSQQPAAAMDSFDFGGPGAFDSTMNNQAAAQAVEQLQ